MKPTQQELESLWNVVVSSLLGYETSDAEEIISLTQDCSDLPYDLMFACVDAVKDSTGKIRQPIEVLE